jgi:hypothetical protein
MIPEKTHFSGDSDREFVAGFLRGYRAWVSRDSARLRSTSMIRYFWNSGVNTSQCFRLTELEEILAHDHTYGCNDRFCTLGPGSFSREQILLEYQNLLGHETPSIDGVCISCGFYALHSPYLSPAVRAAYLTDQPDVYGSIKATGKVVVGELGFRAQYAEIEAIAGPEGEKYAKHYGVPWFPDGLDALAETFPPTRLEGVSYQPMTKPTKFSIPLGGGAGVIAVWNPATGTWDIVAQRRSSRPRTNTPPVAPPPSPAPLPLAPDPVDEPVEQAEPIQVQPESQTSGRRRLWKRFRRLDTRHWFWGIKLDDE